VTQGGQRHVLRGIVTSSYAMLHDERGDADRLVIFFHARISSRVRKHPTHSLVLPSWNLQMLPDIGEVPVLPDEFIGNARFSRRAASRINGHNSRRKQVFRTENAEPRTS